MSDNKGELTNIAAYTLITTAKKKPFELLLKNKPSIKHIY